MHWFNSVAAIFWLAPYPVTRNAVGHYRWLMPMRFTPERANGAVGSDIDDAAALVFKNHIETVSP